jgi:hypothetical protein
MRGSISDAAAATAPAAPVIGAAAPAFAAETSTPDTGGIAAARDPDATFTPPGVPVRAGSTHATPPRDGFLPASERGPLRCRTRTCLSDAISGRPAAVPAAMAWPSTHQDRTLAGAAPPPRPVPAPRPPSHRRARPCPPPRRSPEYVARGAERMREIFMRSGRGVDLLIDVLRATHSGEFSANWTRRNPATRNVSSSRA